MCHLALSYSIKELLIGENILYFIFFPETAKFSRKVIVRLKVHFFIFVSIQEKLPAKRVWSVIFKGGLGAIRT